MRVSWGVISFSPQDIGGAGLPYLVGLAATPCTPTILLEGVMMFFRRLDQKFLKLQKYADGRGVDVVRAGKRLQLRDRATGVALHTSLTKFFIELEAEVNRVVVGAARVRGINARRKV